MTCTNKLVVIERVVNLGFVLVAIESVPADDDDGHNASDDKVQISFNLDDQDYDIRSETGSSDGGDAAKLSVEHQLLDDAVISVGTVHHDGGASGDGNAAASETAPTKDG